MSPLRLAILSSGVILLVLLLRPSPVAARVAEEAKGVVQIFVMQRHVDKVDPQGQGSGFFINETGHVVTNSHVVDKGNHFAILPDDFTGAAGETFQRGNAELVWSSKALDIAILKYTGGEIDIHPMTLGTQLPERGDDVFAIGFPGAAEAWRADGSAFEAFAKGLALTISATVTQGAFSRFATDNTWAPGQATLATVQHNATINPGNSGGPLLDRCGRVIAINTSAVIGEAVGGTYLGSHVSELITILDRERIAYIRIDTPCRGEEATVVALRNAMIGMAVVLLGTAMLAIVALRRPRQQVVRMIDGLSRSIRAGGRTPVMGPAAPIAVGTPRGDAKPTQFGGLVVDGRGPDGRSFHLAIDSAHLDGDRAVIGRDSSKARYVIDHEKVSRTHARLVRRGTSLMVADLGSTNGTFLNGRQLPAGVETEIRPGDELTLGPVRMTVRR